MLPVRDRADLVGAAITSVLQQTCTDLELVVVDDGSTDGTADVIRSFGSAVRSLHVPPGGVYAARNLGVAATSGDLVAFIDSDDRWLPHKLEVQVPRFQRASVGLVHGNARIMGTDRTTFDKTPPHRGHVVAPLAWGNFVATTTVVARREALGRFVEHPLSADYLAWFRIARSWELDHVDEVVAEYRVHEGGISFDLARALEARIELFLAELEHADDPEVRRLLQRTLFNLSLHLGLARLRGRGGRGSLVRAGARQGGVRSPAWLAAFAHHHVRLRSAQGAA